MDLIHQWLSALNKSIKLVRQRIELKRETGKQIKLPKLIILYSDQLTFSYRTNEDQVMCGRVMALFAEVDKENVLISIIRDISTRCFYLKKRVRFAVSQTVFRVNWIGLNSCFIEHPQGIADIHLHRNANAVKDKAKKAYSQDDSNLRLSTV